MITDFEAARVRTDRRAPLREAIASRIGIGRAARLTGLTIRTIRLYEERGMVWSERDRRGMRIYDSAALDRLFHIASLRAMGLTLSAFAGLFEGPACDDRLAAMLTEHHDRLATQLAAVQASAHRLGISLAA